MKAWYALSLACCLLVGTVTAMLPGYGYYQDCTLNNTGSDLTNYQVMFIVNTSSGTSSGTTIYLNTKAELDLDDLRFTNTSDTVYDYWIENATNPYAVWVEVPYIPVGNSTLRVQYDNSGASAYSNGTNTFRLFDHFPGTSLDAKWSNTGNCAVSGSILRVGSGGTGTPYSATTYGTNTAVRANGSFISYSSGTEVLGYFQYSPLNTGVAFNGIGAGAGTIKPVNFNGGSSTAGSNVGGFNAYHIYDVIRNASTNSKFMVDNAGLQTLTTNLPTGSLPVLFYGAASYSVYCDWILVRNYTTPEPTGIAWSAEAAATAALTPFPGCSNLPTDLDADGYCEDVNGNSRQDWSDLILFFTHLAWAQTHEPPPAFDFANDGGTITYADVNALFLEVSNEY